MRLRTESVVLNESRNVYLDAYIIEPTQSEPVGHITTAEVRPAIIICPGGGYMFHADRERLPAALPFLSEGYQAFVLSYSLGDLSEFPNPLVDLSMAVRWVRANAERLHINGEKIATMGFSAGGHCTAMLATQWHLDTWKTQELEDLAAFVQPELTDISNHPNAAILCYATTDMRAFPDLETRRSRDSGIGAISWQRVPESNPIDFVDGNTCPVFLWHTAEDVTVPAAQSIDFARKLLENEVPVELHLFERGEHGLSVGNRLTDFGTTASLPPAVPHWMTLAVRWLNDQFDY